MPDWAKAAVAASSNACFFMLPTLWTSHYFFPHAGLNKPPILARLTRSLQRGGTQKIENRLDDFHRFPLIMSAYSLIIQVIS